MLDAVEGWSWWQVLLLGVALNLATLATSIGLWEVLVRRRGLGDLTRRPVRSEVLLTALTVTVNSVALVPGWWLWREGWIDLAPASVGGTVLGFAYLAVGVEAIMYFVHRVFHSGLLYQWFHRIHHVPDQRMTPIALFVMHPLEAVGFVLVLLGLLALVAVPLASVVLFFGLNLLAGTAAHLPWRAGTPERWPDRWLGGPAMHQAHHEREVVGYGFFTQVVDRALGTRG